MKRIIVVFDPVPDELSHSIACLIGYALGPEEDIPDYDLIVEDTDEDD